MHICGHSVYLTKMSEYEKLREENIRRNQAFLASLGLDEVKVAIVCSVPSSSSSTRPKSKNMGSREEKVKSEPTRRSTRTSTKIITYNEHLNDNENLDEANNIPDGDIILDYSLLPMSLSESELDKYELRCFKILQAWRWRLARLLEIEDYKVFQNRALCEFIRRRRNDRSYATGSDSKITCDMLESFGIGQVKVSKGGLAWQLLDIMNEPDITILLDESRATSASEFEYEETTYLIDDTYFVYDLESLGCLGRYDVASRKISFIADDEEGYVPVEILKKRKRKAANSDFL